MIKREYDVFHVEYDETTEPVEYRVVYPDSEHFQGYITDILKIKRTFHIPESKEIDDYREDYASPTDSLTYFELALNTLQADRASFDIMTAYIAAQMEKTE